MLCRQLMTSKGVDVADFSAIPSEAEVLLPPGCAFIINSVLPKDASGLTIVTLEEDQNAPNLVL